MSTFYLGTHDPLWLARSEVPLFISAVRIRTRCKRKRPVAVVPWALDSGGFSELSLHGRWTVEPATYAREVERWSAEIGRLDWAAIQDWMCEPFILAKTGKTVEQHQALTIESLLTLRALAPGIRWTPVVQGWVVSDYVRHVEAYAAAGVDLRAEPIVGVGSVCRRQGTHEGAEIMRTLARMDLRIHAFGIKGGGLELFGDDIASADSMAWSFGARRRRVRLPGCEHATCANCFRYAMQWGTDVAARRPQQTAWNW